MPPADLSPLNDREYRKLLLALTLDAQRLELLIAISDDRNLQDQLITAYEADLKAQGIATLRARLDPKRPSLRATLEELVARTPALQNGEPAVVTVLNAGELLGVRLSDEKSEQEKFFFSLQWTREALRNFEFPIVLWLPDAVATRLAQQAPDFWSWRGGVFEFVTEARVPERGGMLMMPSREMGAEEQGSLLAIEDLQQQVTQLEQTAPESPLLITLYSSLGKAYEKQYDHKRALELYEKALTLSETKSDIAGQAMSLRNLGDALSYCGRPLQSLNYYQQALSKYREAGDWQGESISLARIGNNFRVLGKYQEAIASENLALSTQLELNDLENAVESLNILGATHFSMGNYQQSIEHYQEALDIHKRLDNPAYNILPALSNLGLAFRLLKQPQKALSYHQKALYIARQNRSLHDVSASLCNIGLAYNDIHDYPQAIQYFQEALELQRGINQRQYESSSLSGLGEAFYSLGQYDKAIENYREALIVRQEIDDYRGQAVSFFNLGRALARVDKKWDARQAYESAKALYQDMGLQQKVEKCDKALYNLGKKIVVEPKKIPTIGEAPPKEPNWLAKSMPSAPRSAPPTRSHKVPITVWFLLLLAALLWWFLR